MMNCVFFPFLPGLTDMEKRRKGGKRTRKRGRSEITEEAVRVVQIEFNLGTEIKMSS